MSVIIVSLSVFRVSSTSVMSARFISMFTYCCAVSTKRAVRLLLRILVIRDQKSTGVVFASPNRSTS
jgi:hypothetical protein